MSNAIRINVKEPAGLDAEIWKRINQPKMLFFLQRGELREDSADVPVTVPEILTSVAESRYHASMRWALGCHYYRLRSERGGVVPNPEEIKNGRLFRKALGIVLEHPAIEVIDKCRQGAKQP